MKFWQSKCDNYVSFFSNFSRIARGLSISSTGRGSVKARPSGLEIFCKNEKPIVAESRIRCLSFFKFQSNCQRIKYIFNRKRKCQSGFFRTGSGPFNLVKTYDETFHETFLHLSPGSSCSRNGSKQ